MATNDRQVGLALAVAVACGWAGCTGGAGDPNEDADADGGAVAPAATEQAPAYPAARRDEAAVDTYFDTQVPDPYRWLEQPDDPEVKAWIAAENTLTDAWLASVPERAAIRGRLEALWNHERFGLPRKMAGKLLYEHNSGLQNQNELAMIDGGGGSADGPPKVVLDANTFSADGTVPLTSWSLADDGRHLAYGTSDGGSDWNTLKVRDVETGKDLPDEIRWVKFSEASWLPDGSGFFYGRYPEPTPGAEEDALANQRVFLHRLGTSQEHDELILETPDQPQWGYDVRVSDDHRWLVATVWQGSEEKSRVWVRKLTGGRWVKLLDAFDAMYTYVGNGDGDQFWFWTDNGAAKGRLIEVDGKNAAPEAWKTVIPEGADQLQSVGLVGDRFIATYLKDAHSAVAVYDLTGKRVGEVPLPALGTVDGFDGKRTDTETYFSFTSFTQPPQVYRYDVATGDVELFREPRLDFDPSPYVTEQRFFSSKDGTKIPMFVVRRADAVLDGSTPTLLYGYGGFNIPITPSFSVPNAVWLEMGGIYVSANLRGGSEYGREWHEAGTKLRKQNVFDDFIGAAEDLIAAKITRPDKLAIHGRSNGGLLVGATLLQRPDLFGAAIPGVGVLDMLKYHTWTIGWGWASDYGTSAESREMFEALRAYSPVHNCRPAQYPPTLILTADHDDRVVPAHSFKFAAALQAAQQGTRPILARIDTRAGHGAGKSVAMQIDEKADTWAFLVKSLGMQLGAVVGGPSPGLPAVAPAPAPEAAPATP